MSNKKELNKVDNGQLGLDLFELDPLLDKNYSNTLEIYDIIGKYQYEKSGKFMKELKASDGEFSRQTVYQGHTINVSVTAANIERKGKNGEAERVFVFPGPREEIIEDALKKMSTEKNRSEAYKQTVGKDNGQLLVGIGFSIFELQKELKRVGKTYSHNEIKEALEIMNKAGLNVASEDGAIDISAPFFPFVAISEKANKEVSRSFVCFHPFVTQVVLTKQFRRYNYQKSLTFTKNYSRAMYKRLSHRWIQAAPDKPYAILLSTLLREMKTPNAKLFKDKELFIGVFDDLLGSDVLSHYEAAPKKEGRRIIDWLFTLYPTETFSKQQASNNKVQAITKAAPDSYLTFENEA